jgi:hypothetical protein
MDVHSCINHCELNLSPRVVYRREDFVASLAQCSQIQPCAPQIDREINRCEWDVRRRLEPSPLDKSYCHALVDKSLKCGDYRWDEEHCLADTKSLTDPILRQLSDCLDHPCRGLSNYGRCEIAVVGDDPVMVDPDREEEFFRSTVPDAGPTQARLTGRVLTDTGAAVVGATVCLHALRDAPCVRSSESGSFALDVPAHDEIAISVVASGFGNRLVAVTTTGTGAVRLTLTLFGEASSRARYAAANATFPDSAAGSVFATAEGPQGGSKGIEGATIEVEPKADRSTLYFGPSSEPDRERAATSTWSHALVTGLPSGQVTITYGPPSLTCVPVYGAWPSPHPNSLRAPVAAGFETRVIARCHW